MAGKKIIAVLGATGSQGGGLVRSILKDPAGEFAVRALTRNAGSPAARDLAAAGAEVVTVDLDKQETLARAFFRWRVRRLLRHVLLGPFLAGERAGASSSDGSRSEVGRLGPCHLVDA